MMNVSYTAYLPEPKIFIREKKANYEPESLKNFSKLLEKQNTKLNYLDSECMANWDKCNRFYLSARKLNNINILNQISQKIKI